MSPAPVFGSVGGVVGGVVVGGVVVGGQVVGGVVVGGVVVGGVVVGGQVVGGPLVGGVVVGGVVGGHGQVGGGGGHGHAPPSGPAFVASAWGAASAGSGTESPACRASWARASPGTAYAPVAARAGLNAVQVNNSPPVATAKTRLRLAKSYMGTFLT
jgi:hypothetical protein